MEVEIIEIYIYIYIYIYIWRERQGQSVKQGHRKPNRNTQFDRVRERPVERQGQALNSPTDRESDSDRDAQIYTHTEYFLHLKNPVFCLFISTLRNSGQH